MQQEMKGRLAVVLMIMMAIALLAPLVAAGDPQSMLTSTVTPTATGSVTAQIAQLDMHWVWVTIVLLILIIGGGFGYLYVLQRQYLNACLKEKQLSLFFNSPGGLPIGTVRAVLALIIIATSLYLAVLSFFNILGKDNTKFPEVLSGILGAVLGFYFGSRTAGKGEEEALQTQIKGLKTDRDNIEQEKEAGESSGLISDVKKGLTMSKAVLSYLPEDVRKKYGGYIEKLETGVKTAEQLTQGGKIKESLEKAADLFDTFKKENPFRDIYHKVIDTASGVLGGAAPATAAILAVAGISVKISRAAYEKWKCRILNMPFNPAVVPLKVVDANTGFSLLSTNPVFKEAFKQELAANDRPFMEGAVFKFTKQENTETLWDEYKGRFSSRQDFEDGLQAFRKAVAEGELASEIDPAWLAEAGGRGQLLESMDKLNNDEGAKAALHEFVTAVEGLQRSGQSPAAILDKVRQEAKS